MKTSEKLIIALIFSIASFASALVCIDSVLFWVINELIIFALIFALIIVHAKEQYKEKNKLNRKDLENKIEKRLKEISINKLFKNKLKNI
jgi:hypothetical protein